MEADPSRPPRLVRTLLTADFVIQFDGVGHTEREDGAVLVDGDRIVFVGARSEAPVSFDERIDLGHSVLLPGLIDLDALADIDHLVLDSWSDGEAAARLTWSAAYEQSGRSDVLTPEERRVMRTYALVQLALHGITTIMPIASETHSRWAETHDDLLDVATTASRIGLRSFLGPSYRSGVHITTDDGSPDLVWNDDEGSRGFAEAVRFLDTVDELADPLVTGVLAPCRIETVPDHLLVETADVSARRDVLVRVHATQERGERALSMAVHGAAPLDRLERVGLLNPRTLIAHGIYLDVHPEMLGEDRGDLGTLATAGVSIVHCPLTNNRYASHLHKLSQYLDAGVNIALGTDSFPPDLIRAIDTGVQLAKAQHGLLGRGMLAEYIDAATTGGARALRRPDLGRLAPGAAADIVAFALDDFRTGPTEDPLRTLTLAGSGRDLRFSMIAGRVIVRDGTIVGVDCEALRSEGQRIFDTLCAAYRGRDYRAGSGEPLFPPVFRRAEDGRPRSAADARWVSIRE